MEVSIYSRKAIGELIEKGFPQNTAVISFYTPKSKRDYKESRVDYSGVCGRVFYVGIPDIDIEILSEYGYTYKTYLAEADELAKFIDKAKENGLDIICQCDYGQSRSAACAAAIEAFSLISKLRLTEGKATVPLRTTTGSVRFSAFSM